MIQHLKQNGHRGAHAVRRGRCPRRLAGLVVPFLMVIGAEAHAVTVSPTALYIDSRSRTGFVTLYNPGVLPEEIEIGFAFGYPQSDSAGLISVPLVSAAPSGEPSAVEWMRAFPRRLVLQPGQRQVLRVLVTPPPGLADGEYWARLLITARGGQPPIEQVQNGVTTQISVETVMVVAANYRAGQVSSGVRVVDSGISLEGDTLVLTTDLERDGNAAFLGRMHARVLDANGNVVQEAEELIAVYHQLRQVLRIPLPGGATGPFSVRLNIDTEREDLPPEGPLPMTTVSLLIPGASS